MRRFINADLLAAGLSPLDPVAQLAAGRLFLSELDRLATAKEDFAFESTLSALTYLPRLRQWKQAGYRLEIVYLKLSDVRLSLERISSRVRSGGHNVPEADARRRFTWSWDNLNHNYLPLADAAWVFAVSGPQPILFHEKP